MRNIAAVISGVSMILVSASAMAGEATLSNLVPAKQKRVPNSVYNQTEIDISLPVSLRRPNVFGVEVLGRGAAYSFTYDRSFADTFAFGAGFSYYDGLSVSGSKVNLIVMPLYANVYFSKNSHRGFVTGGLDIAKVTGPIAPNGFGTSVFDESGIFPVVGAGYEFRGENGFLFRIAPYLLVANGVHPWLGLTFGGAF
jgi:hypothetical protein